MSNPPQVEYERRQYAERLRDVLLDIERVNAERRDLPGALLSALTAGDDNRLDNLLSGWWQNQGHLVALLAAQLELTVKIAKEGNLDAEEHAQCIRGLEALARGLQVTVNGTAVLNSYNMQSTGEGARVLLVAGAYLVEQARQKEQAR